MSFFRLRKKTNHEYAPLTSIRIDSFETKIDEKPAQNIAGVPLLSELWDIVLSYDIMSDDDPIKRLRNWKMWGENNPTGFVTKALTKLPPFIISFHDKNPLLNYVLEEKINDYTIRPLKAMLNTIWNSLQQESLDQKNKLVPFLLNRDVQKKKSTEQKENKEEKDQPATVNTQKINKARENLLSIYSDPHINNITTLKELAQYTDLYLMKQLTQETLLSISIEKPHSENNKIFKHPQQIQNEINTVTNIIHRKSLMLICMHHLLWFIGGWALITAPSKFHSPEEISFKEAITLLSLVAAILGTMISIIRCTYPRHLEEEATVMTRVDFFGRRAAELKIEEEPSEQKDNNPHLHHH